MDSKNDILERIKNSVKTTDPGATLILYGSYARGDYQEDSDIDILVLIDTEKASIDDWQRIISSTSAIELETGCLISPFVTSKKEWATHKVTPFYENVIREGIML